MCSRRYFFFLNRSLHFSHLNGFSNSSRNRRLRSSGESMTWFWLSIFITTLELYLFHLFTLSKIVLYVVISQCSFSASFCNWSVQGKCLKSYPDHADRLPCHRFRAWHQGPCTRSTRALPRIPASCNERISAFPIVRHASYS